MEKNCKTCENCVHCYLDEAYDEIMDEWMSLWYCDLTRKVTDYEHGTCEKFEGFKHC